MLWYLVCLSVLATQTVLCTRGFYRPKTKKIVCYYNLDAATRKGEGKMSPKNIDPFLCTHIIFAFAKLQETTIEHDRLYTEVSTLKDGNKNLKVLLSIGRFGPARDMFSKVSSTSSNRNIFARKAVNFLRAYTFDGLDVCWLYPTRSGDRAERGHFEELMKALMLEFYRDQMRSGEARLIVSACFPLEVNAIKEAYDFYTLNRYVDLFNIHTFNFFGPWDHKTSIATPMKALSQQFPDLYYNVATVTNYYILQAVPRFKIMMGITTFATTFNLTETKHHGIGAKSNGPGLKGPYTETSGRLAYYEVCSKAKEKPAAVKYKSGKYLYRGNQWISFEDEETIREKMCYASKMQLGGIHIWTVDEDDFFGTMCTGLKYPLINEAVLHFKHFPFSWKCARNPVYRVDKRSVRSERFSKRADVCADGQRRFEPHPTNCTKFYHCTTTEALLLSCPKDQVFDPVNMTCAPAGSVPDCF